MKSFGVEGLAFAATFTLGCTFYTDCPCANAGGAANVAGTTTAGGTTGNGGAGGSGTAGSGDTPGAGGDDGSGGTSSGGANGGNAGTNIAGAGASAPAGEWIDVTSNLGDELPECTAVSLLSSKPDEDLIITGIAMTGLWGTRDGGETWEQLGTKSGSDPVTNAPSEVVYDPEDPDTFWEVGDYLVSGLYRTDDGGDSFEQLGDLFHVGSLAVDFDDPDRQTLIVSIHESGQLLRSEDGGTAWEEITDTLPDDAPVCGVPHIVDRDTYVIGCSQYGDGRPGVLRTTNAADSWARVSDIAATTEILVHSDGTLYWTTDDGGMMKSDDQGESWIRFAPALTFATISPVELPDGRIAAISQGVVVVSDDQGDNWKPVTTFVPQNPLGFVYSGYQKAFFVFHLVCLDSERTEDAVLRYDFDYEAE